LFRYYPCRQKPSLVNQIRVEECIFLVSFCVDMLSLLSVFTYKTTLLARLFLLGIPCLVMGSLSSMSIAVSGELDGRGLSCVGVGGPAEDLFYGFVFANDRVKALSIVRGKLYIPADDEDVPYTFDGQDRIEWRSKHPLPETRTPSSGFTHIVDSKTLKHTVLGEKGGFEGGLCFFDTAAGVKMGLLQTIEIP